MTGFENDCPAGTKKILDLDTRQIQITCLTIDFKWPEMHLIGFGAFKHPEGRP